MSFCARFISGIDRMFSCMVLGEAGMRSVVRASTGSENRRAYPSSHAKR